MTSFSVLILWKETYEVPGVGGGGDLINMAISVDTYTQLDAVSVNRAQLFQDKTGKPRESMYSRECGHFLCYMFMKFPVKRDRAL